MRTLSAALLALLLFTPAPVARAGKESAPVAAARKLFEAQLKAITVYEEASTTAFAADGAVFVDLEQYSGTWKPDEMPQLFDQSSGGAGPVKVVKKIIVASADGKSAWIFAQLSVKQYDPGDSPGYWVDYRVTELAAEKDGVWTLVATYWTQGLADKEANKRYAEGGTTPPERIVAGDADEGDAELAKLVGDAFRGGTLADLVSERADVTVVGSAPKELVSGGKKWKKALGGWKDRLHLIGGVRAGLAPGGTTGWAIATFAIDKDVKGKKYQIPFRAFLVLEKGEAGWQVVQAHLAIPR